MSVYVLVHGGNVSTQTWNSLVPGSLAQTPDGKMGGAVWQLAARPLMALGHKVYAPTLGDEHLFGLNAHVEQVCSLLESENLENVVLAGHSYGGMVITGAGSRMAERVGRLVYLDAALPDSGQSLFDCLSSSGLDPLAEIPGLERTKAYEEKLYFDPEPLKKLKKTFIRCTESELRRFVDVSVSKIERSPENWTVRELHSGHLAPATHPEELSRLLIEAAV
ncbi:MAG: alpha/beta hydrolase [Elusimicrobia bacterium]|nr:alpha/beta hydrolase [Elusimicrobiota bacterium]